MTSLNPCHKLLLGGFLLQARTKTLYDFTQTLQKGSEVTRARDFGKKMPALLLAEPETSHRDVNPIFP